MEDKPTVLLVDDDHSVRTSLERLIRSRGWNVKSFETPTEFLNAADDHCTGWCVLLDYVMPEMSGLSLQKELLRLGIDMPVIFMSGQADIPVCAVAMKLGAVDFMVKPVEEDVLFEVLNRSFEQYQANCARKHTSFELEEVLARVSQRERQVMDQVVRGRLNKQIAYDLGIAEKTVKVHRARVMEKTGAKSLADLVRMCIRAGIIDPD